jgi:ATP-dependent Clp protease ATP-binding subunit ClpA
LTGHADIFPHSLEKALHRALALANERRHEYATLEHLLLSLTDDKDAAAVMKACSVDLEVLRRDPHRLHRHRTCRR